MNNIARDQATSLLSKYAGRASLFALAAIAIGILFGFGAVDLYETASHWVLKA